MTEVAHIDISTKFCRDERWDVLRRAFHILEEQAKDKVTISPSEVGEVLLRAGAVRPHWSLEPIAKGGSRVRFTAYSDGSIAHSFLN